MYIEAVPNRSSPAAILLRESYRQDGKVRKRTLCNLSDWPTAHIEGLRGVLKGGTVISAKHDAFTVTRTLSCLFRSGGMLMERVRLEVLVGLATMSACHPVPEILPLDTGGSLLIQVTYDPDGGGYFTPPGTAVHRGWNGTSSQNTFGPQPMNFRPQQSQPQEPVSPTYWVSSTTFSNLQSGLWEVNAVLSGGYLDGTSIDCNVQIPTFPGSTTNLYIFTQSDLSNGIFVGGTPGISCTEVVGPNLPPQPTD